MTVRLLLVQRASAAMLALFVLVHLTAMTFAVRGGLTAAEILGRTRGSASWGLFYGLFVAVAAAHGAIGLRTVLIEWAGLNPRAAGGIAGAAGILLLVLGLRAVWAVCVGGAP